MIKQIVIDKTTKNVKRWGYCDFQNDGTFNSDTEQIIEKEFIFNPDIDEQDWQYDNGSGEFVKI